MYKIKDFWNQWLLSFTAVRDRPAELHVSALQGLPDDLRGFAHCLYHHQQVWSDNAGVRRELAIQGYSKEPLLNAVAHVSCLRESVALWAQGALWRRSIMGAGMRQQGTLNARQREALLRFTSQVNLREDSK